MAGTYYKITLFFIFGNCEPKLTTCPFIRLVETLWLIITHQSQWQAPVTRCTTEFISGAVHCKAIIKFSINVFSNSNTHNCISLILDSNTNVVLQGRHGKVESIQKLRHFQGCSQPHSPGCASVSLALFFPQISINCS